MAEMAVQSAFIEANAVGPGGTSPWFVFGIDVQAPKQTARMVFLVKIPESFGGRVVAWIWFSIQSNDGQAGVAFSYLAGGFHLSHW